MMTPNGDIIPLDPDEVEKLRKAIGNGKLVGHQIVSIGDLVIVNGRECRVRKITNKDIILRPVPISPLSELEGFVQANAGK